jgi:serine/threonine protein kinase
LSRSLIDILDRLLQIEYQHRYRSVAELLPDLNLLDLDLNVSNRFSTLPTYQITQNMTNSLPTQLPEEIAPDDWFKAKRDRDSLWQRLTKFLLEEH